jgi:hypothetical protein
VVEFTQQPIRNYVGNRLVKAHICSNAEELQKLTIALRYTPSCLRKGSWRQRFSFRDEKLRDKSQKKIDRLKRHIDVGETGNAIQLILCIFKYEENSLKNYS